MELLIAIIGFIGAWLLVAGAVYQAALELKEENVNHEHFDAIKQTVDPAPPVSVLWWFLPPVKWYLERRRSRLFRERFITVLSPEDAEALISFLNKANGWLIVAAGGWLLAMKETYDTLETLRLPVWVLPLAVVAMSLLCILFTVLTSRRSKDVLATKRSS